MDLAGVDTGNSCMDPATFERWSGEQLHLVEMDPEWSGSPSKPDGDGWIWCSFVADVMRRFCGFRPFPGLRLTRVPQADVEIVAAANDANRYGAVHERLYSYGFQYGWGDMVHGYRSPGLGLGIDIEGRGGAWVRRIEDPPPWVFGEPDEDE